MTKLICLELPKKYHVSAMMDSLETAREFWRVFELNNSEGAGMKITENGIVTKSYGADTEVRGKVMGDSIVFHRENTDAKRGMR